MTFDEAFDILLGHEGTYSNNPSDPGGETMWGVTIVVARANGYAGPMRDLPRDKAKEIYKVKYWDTINADKLPDGVRFDVFDASVNSGAQQASKWLQRTVGTPADGIIGPATIDAANKAGPMLAAHYLGTRLQFMANLATWPAFGRGWANRIASNLQRLEA